MSLIYTITGLYEFEDFYKYVGGENDFSQNAKEKIFEYYRYLDVDIEFDPTTFAEDFTEYTDPWDIIRDYGLEEWYDRVDVHEVELTIEDWANLVEDEAYLEEILPKDALYYDEELEEYMVLDYSRKVRLDEMEDYYWLKFELLNYENFKDIINNIVDKGDLLFYVGEELEKSHTIWDLSGSILILNK